MEPMGGLGNNSAMVEINSLNTFFLLGNLAGWHFPAHLKSNKVTCLALAKEV